MILQFCFCKTLKTNKYQTYWTKPWNNYLHLCLCCWKEGIQIVFRRDCTYGYFEQMDKSDQVSDLLKAGELIICTLAQKIGIYCFSSGHVLTCKCQNNLSIATLVNAFTLPDTYGEEHFKAILNIVQTVTFAILGVMDGSWALTNPRFVSNRYWDYMK